MAFFLLPSLDSLPAPKPRSKETMKNHSLTFCLVALLLTICGLSASAQPPAIDLGTLTGVASVQGMLSASETAWYQFQYERTEGDRDFLDITTNFDDGGAEILDTELALFNDDGMLLSDARGRRRFRPAKHILVQYGFG